MKESIPGSLGSWQLTDVITLAISEAGAGLILILIILTGWYTVSTLCVALGCACCRDVLTLWTTRTAADTFSDWTALRLVCTYNTGN